MAFIKPLGLPTSHFGDQSYQESIKFIDTQDDLLDHQLKVQVYIDLLYATGHTIDIKEIRTELTTVPGNQIYYLTTIHYGIVGQVIIELPIEP